MKPADLREFAEKLYVSAPRHEEFAKEILDMLDLQEDSVEAEMIEELEEICPEGFHGKDPLKMIEYLGDRDAVLMEIDEKIQHSAQEMTKWGIQKRALADVDDTVGDLLDMLDCIDAVLRAEGLDGDIHDMLDELVQRANKTVPEKPKLEYDL